MEVQYRPDEPRKPAEDQGLSVVRDSAVMERLPHSIARRAWVSLEALHACAYFAPEVGRAYGELGLRYWAGYFGARSSPLGAVPPSVVTATFYGFHPSFVAKWVPAVWEVTSPGELRAAHVSATGTALRRILGDAATSAEVAEAVSLAAAAAAAADTAGRPLAAAWQALETPDEPLLALWHAATVLREHRGDGHVVALVSEGLGPVEAHLTLAHTGRAPVALLRLRRGWLEDDFAAGTARLQRRGLAHDDGHLTDVGRRLRDSIEVATDRLAMVPYQALGAEGCERLLTLLAPLAGLVADAGVIPYPNPVGAPRPTLTRTR